MSIQKIHEDIYQRLMSERQNDPEFYFMPRRRIDARFKKGYWFLGDEHYVSVSFWNGFDTTNKTANISFIVVPSKSKHLDKRDRCRSFIQLTARDSILKSKFLEKMASEIPGFKKFVPGEWNKRYKSINHMKNLEEFLKNDKPLIDEFIAENDIEGLSLLGKDSLRYLQPIKEQK